MFTIALKKKQKLPQKEETLSSLPKLENVKNQPIHCFTSDERAFKKALKIFAWGLENKHCYLRGT